MMNSFEILESSTSNHLKKKNLKPQFFSELELKRVITQLRKERILKKLNKPSPIKILQIPLNTAEISVSNFSFEKITNNEEEESGKRNEELLRKERKEREKEESEGVKEDKIKISEEEILQEENILSISLLSSPLPPKVFELNSEIRLIGNDWEGGKENVEQKSNNEEIKEKEILEWKKEENQKPIEEKEEIDKEKVKKDKDKPEKEYNRPNYFFFEFTGENKKVIKNLERRIEKLKKIRQENESKNELKARSRKAFKGKKNLNNIILEENETEENDSPQEQLMKEKEKICSKEEKFPIQHLCGKNQLKEKSDKSLFINTKKYLQSKEINEKFFERFLGKNKEIINFLNKPLEEKKMEGNLKNEQIRKGRKERNMSKYFRSKSTHNILTKKNLLFFQCEHELENLQIPNLDSEVKIREKKKPKIPKVLWEELHQILFEIVNKRTLNKNLKEKISFFLKQVPKTLNNQIAKQTGGVKKNTRMVLIEKKLDPEELIAYKKIKGWIEEMLNKFSAKTFKELKKNENKVRIIGISALTCLLLNKSETKLPFEELDELNNLFFKEMNQDHLSLKKLPEIIESRLNQDNLMFFFEISGNLFDLYEANLSENEVFLLKIVYGCKKMLKILKKNQLILLDSKPELQINKKSKEILLKSKSERALNKNREKNDFILQKYGIDFSIWSSKICSLQPKGFKNKRVNSSLSNERKKENSKNTDLIEFLKLMKKQRKEKENERILSDRQHYSQFNCRVDQNFEKEILNYRREDIEEHRRIKAEQTRRKREEIEVEEAFKRGQRMIEQFKQIIQFNYNENLEIANVNDAKENFDEKNLEREEKLLEFEEFL